MVNGTVVAREALRKLPGSSTAVKSSGKTPLYVGQPAVYIMNADNLARI